MAGEANAGEVRARLVLDNSNFRRNMQQARQDMSSFGSSDTKKMKENVDKIKDVALGMGGAVVGVVGASVAAAANFQQSMSRLSAMSNANSTQYKQLQDAAMEWGQKTKYSATEAADALTELSMAGFSVKDSITALPATLGLAAAGGLNLSSATDIAGAALNGFQLKADRLGHVVDVLAEAANTSNSDITDLGESMKYAAPVAQSVGWSIEETTAAIAKMSNVGIKGSQAGTTLRMSLLALSKPAANTSKMMEKLGIDIEDSHGHMKSLPALIDNVKNSLQGMTQVQKLATVGALVGTESASGFLALIKDGSKDLSDYTQQLKNSDGAAIKMAATMQDNLMGAWENFTGSVETLGIKVGNQFLPTFTAAVQKATDFTNVLMDLDPSLISTAIKTAGVASATMLIGVGVMKAIESLKKLKLAFIDNPVGLAITGFTLLASAVTAVATHEEEARKVSLDHYNVLDKQQRALQPTIDSFDKLQAKNKLNNDEMLRYIDIQKELQDTSDPSRIKTLSGALDVLQKKSGLSKDEMNKLIKANGDLIDQAPNTETAISNTGSAFAKSTKAAKELNASLIEQKRLELDLQQAKMEANVETHINDYKDAVDGVNKSLSLRNAKEANIGLILQQREGLEKKLAAAQKLTGKAKDDAVYSAKQELLFNEADLNAAKDQFAQAQEIYIQKRKGLSTSSEQLTKDKEIYDAINSNLLAEVDLTAQKGKEKDVINAAIKSEQAKVDAIAKQAGGVDKLKGKQKEAYQNAQSLLSKYKDVSGQIADNQAKQAGTNKKIQDGRDSAAKLNKELSEDQAKHIKFTGDGQAKAKAIDDELGKPVQKNVFVRLIESAGNEIAKLIGLKRHMGGTLPKYHTGGSPALSRQLNAPKMDEVDARLLRNEMVLTAEQQASLFKMIKTYNGAAVSLMNKQSKNHTNAQPTVINIAALHVREEADVKKVAEQLQQLAQRRQRSRGEY